MDRVCPTCGREPGAGSFCQHCGANLATEAAPQTPPPQASAPQPIPPTVQPPRRRSGLGIGCLAAVAIFLVVIVVGGFFAWRFFNDNVLPAVEQATEDLIPIEDAPPGPCYDLETEEGLLTGWSEVSCDGPRQYEVTFVADFNAGPFPGDEYLAIQAAETCSAAFEAYVGVPAEQSSFNMDWLVPTEPVWESGNRQGICLATAGEEQLTGTIKDSGR